MSQDGADLGVGMQEALGAVLGGEEPKKVMDVMEMREYILSAPDVPTSYDEAGRAVAKLVLTFMERHPETADMPADSELQWPKKANGETDWNAKPITVTEGLYEYIKRVEPGYGAAVFEDMTGFMWGWGVNAARRCCELPPVANPAIIEIRA